MIAIAMRKYKNTMKVTFDTVEENYYTNNSKISAIPKGGKVHKNVILESMV